MKFNQFLPELPFPQAQLATHLQKEHQRNVERFPGWNVLATRRKMACQYWEKVIFNHFAFLVVAAAAVVLPFNRYPLLTNLSGMIIYAIPIFFLLFFTMYLPNFQMEFLPHLDNCVENYKARHLDGIQQSKKLQYSVLSLMLIQYTFNQLAGQESILTNAANAQLLSRQYGVSVKSITPALNLIGKGDWDRKSIRKRTEITDDFDTAREYFTGFSETRAIPILDKLQQKILKQS